MYLLLNHLKEGSPSTEEDDPSTVILSDCYGGCYEWLFHVFPMPRR